MTMLFGGFVLREPSSRDQLPVIFDPTESQIDDVINLFSCYEGILGLRHSHEPKCGPYRLSLQAEKEGIFLKRDNCLYLLMLDQYDSDGEIRVRTIHNHEFPAGLAIHWGEPYPSRARTRDLELVRSIFREFARTGNVSENIMS